MFVAVLCALSACDAKDGFVCEAGALQVDRVDEGRGRIHGAVYVPDEEYQYSLSADQGPQSGEVLHLQMILIASDQERREQGRKGFGERNMFYELNIDEMIALPEGAQGVMIDVAKPYSGMPEYFLGKFEGARTVCMPPDMYK